MIANGICERKWPKRREGSDQSEADKELAKMSNERARQLKRLEAEQDRWDASRNPDIVAKNVRLTAASKAARKQTRADRKQRVDKTE